MTEKIAKSFSEEEVKKITEIQSKVISITSRIHIEKESLVLLQRHPHASLPKLTLENTFP